MKNLRLLRVTKTLVQRPQPDKFWFNDSGPQEVKPKYYDRGEPAVSYK